MGSGKAPKAAEWPSDGWVVEGEVVGIPKSYHVREYDKENPGGGKLKFYPSGEPIQGVSIDLKTTLRELGNPEDSGIRRAYIDKVRLLTAVRDAVRVVGAAGVEAGGFLTIVRTGTEPGQGSIPATTWAAMYSKPGQWQQPTAIPARPPEWAQGPQVLASVPAAQSPGGWQGQYPAQPQAPAQGYVQQPPAQPSVDVWSGQPAQGPAGMTTVAQQHATQAAQTGAAMASAKPTITASAAAALANGGVDITGFNIVPG
jgi:hypothetical protein